MNNNQQFQYQPVNGGDPNSQPQQQQNNAPNPYVQYGQQNQGVDYNQPGQNQHNLGSNPNNLPNASYPQVAQPQYGNPGSNVGQPLGQNQQFQKFDGQQQFQNQQPGQNFCNIPGGQQDGSNPPVGAQTNMAGGPPQDRNAGYAGYQNTQQQQPGQTNHGQPQFNQGKQPDYLGRQDGRQGVNSQTIRTDTGIPGGLGQPPASNFGQSNPSLQPQQNQQQTTDQNMIGGFLRQNAGQPQMQTSLNQSATMDASGINDTNPQFNYTTTSAGPPAESNPLAPNLLDVGAPAGTDSNQLNFQYSGMPGGQPNGAPGALPGAPKAGDPNSMDIGALNRMAEYYATNSDYPRAIEYFEKMTNICRENGHAWTALGHCYLLKEDLHKSFQAYQNALYYLENIMDPQLWYGIGILYEKFESYEHAISSLMAVLKMSPNFYQKSEVLSRLGYIFAKTNDLSNAIVYFQNSILTNTFTAKRKVEILIKIGILHEEKNELMEAQKSYEAAMSHEEDNFTIYQHLSWN